MLINIFIIVVIFGYATYTLRKFFQKSKQGKCAGCSIQYTCKGSVCGEEKKRE